MPVLNLTKVEAFALHQIVYIEMGASYEAMRDANMPRFDPERLLEKIANIVPPLAEVEHLFRADR